MRWPCSVQNVPFVLEVLTANFFLMDLFIANSLTALDGTAVHLGAKEGRQRSLRIFFETFMLQNYGTSKITRQGPSTSVGWTSDLFLCPPLSLSPLCASLFLFLSSHKDEAPLPLIKINLTSHYTRLTLISCNITKFSFKQME